MTIHIDNNPAYKSAEQLVARYTADYGNHHPGCEQVYLIQREGDWFEVCVRRQRQCSTHHKSTINQGE